LLNRLQRRVAEGVLAPSDVAMYFSRRDPLGAQLDPLRLSKYGDIENWPENFFGDEMEDIAARTLAAMKRRKAEGDMPSSE
jgi:predicted ATPase